MAEQDLGGLRDAIYAMESGSRYDCVADTCGVLTLGAGQWYGDEARVLLQSIQAADAEAFAALDTAGIAEQLTSGNWLDFRPTAEQAACIGAILGSEAGIACQDSRMELSLEACLTQAKALGVTDPEAAVLCAGALRLTGENAVSQLLAQLDDVTAEALTAADPICRALSRYL